MRNDYAIEMFFTRLISRESFTRANGGFGKSKSSQK